MKEQIRKILLDTHPRYWTRKITDSDMLEYLTNSFPGKSLIQCLTLVKFGHDSVPICTECNINELSIYPNRITSFCSHTCSSNATKNQRLSKTKETLKERYGVSNAIDVPGAIDKIKATKLERYGTLAPVSFEVMKERANHMNALSKITLKEKYNVINSGQIPGHRSKCKATTLAKYGVDSYFKSDEFLEKQQNYRFDLHQTEFEEVLKIDQPDDYLKAIHQNPNYRITFKCKKCDTISKIPMETFKYRIRYLGSVCSKCNNISTYRSFQEESLFQFITANTTLAVESNTRKVIYPYELDIYIPELNLAIEYCGLYWHRDPKVDALYHYRKWQACDDLGIKLITIFEDELIYKREIVESRLLTALNKTPTLTYARKCKVIELKPDIARQFVDKHHIQGYVPATVKLGLEYNNEIVAVMTFSSLSKAKGSVATIGNWEISRFCSAGNIPGSASKLFKHFVRFYSPDLVISYADLRWGGGSVYKHLDFEYKSTSRPGYWYFKIKELIRYHRYSLRKNAQDDQSLTEWENRQLQGWDRIWDCGHAKWVWTKEID